MTKYKTLENKLISLSKKTYNMITKAKRSDRLIKVPYHSIPVRSINYKQEWYDMEWEKVRYFDLYEWKIMDFADFYDNELISLPEYMIASKEMAKVFSIEQVLGQQAVDSFLRPLAQNLSNGEYDEVYVKDFINFFIKGCVLDVSKGKINWRVNIGLRDIIIDSNQLEIYPGKFLSRVNKEQLKIFEPMRHIEERSKMLNIGFPLTATFLSFATLADQYSGFGEHDIGIYKEMELWLTVLQLFKPGSVNIGSEHIIPDFFFDRPYFKNRESTFDKSWVGKVDYKNTSNFKQWIRKNEEKKLILFAKRMQPILEKVDHNAYLDGSPVDLALHRYKDALVKSEVNAYRILSSITSLEALLSDTQSEINYKIKLRLAGLLSHFGFDSKAVMDRTSKAYELRSRLVHGDKTKPALLDFANSNVQHIINYNRICLLVYLQLKDKFSKIAFIEILDESLVNVKKRTELKSILSKEVFIPIIRPFKEN